MLTIAIFIILLCLLHENECELNDIYREEEMDRADKRHRELMERLPEVMEKKEKRTVTRRRIMKDSEGNLIAEEVTMEVES